MATSKTMKLIHRAEIATTTAFSVQKSVTTAVTKASKFNVKIEAFYTCYSVDCRVTDSVSCDLATNQQSVLQNDELMNRVNKTYLYYGDMRYAGASYTREILLLHRTLLKLVFKYLPPLMF